jgi:formate hydrogenlyase subunit 3/multisubunit Na+/H+ antiporter MnhD subunit
LSAPFLILLLGTVLAVAAFALRARGGTPWLIASGGSVLLAMVAAGIVMGDPFEILGMGVLLETGWTFLGRSLVLTPDNRALVAFVFLSGAVLLVSGWVSDAPRRLAPVGLLMLLALAAAMMIQPFVFAPTLIAAAAILACLVVVRPRGMAGRAPSRLMVSYTLGMMAILIAGWLIEVGGATTSPESPARAASVLLGLGLAILVITPPFHTWLTACADEAHPLAFVFVAIVLQTGGLFLLVNSLASYAWMRTDPVVFGFLRGIGFLMIILGGLWCLVERRAPRLIGYTLLVNAGVSLLALSMATPDGPEIALGMAAARPLGVAVWAAGVTNLFGAGAAAVDGQKSIRALPAAAALLGAFSLAGFPLTAGFPGQWMTLANSQGSEPVVVAAVVFGLGTTWFAIGRWGWTLSTHPVDDGNTLPRSRTVALVGGLALILLFAVLPGWIFSWAPAAFAAIGAG